MLEISDLDIIAMSLSSSENHSRRQPCVAEPNRRKVNFLMAQLTCNKIPYYSNLLGTLAYRARHIEGHLGGHVDIGVHCRVYSLALLSLLFCSLRLRQPLFYVL